MVVNAAQRQGLTATGRAALNLRGDDLYETPQCATLALIDAEPLPNVIWEPSCGPGSIVQVLRAIGHVVHATDLVDYGCPDSISRIDFLMERSAPAGTQAIVTNPPFKLAGQFVRHALELSPLVVMLLRLAFLEGAGRSDILDGGQLARVLVFKQRLERMHRAGWTGPKSTSSVAFAWFVWSRSHYGPAIINRISWR